MRGQAAAIAAAVDWIANFAAIVFVLRFLPETKGHSVEEIIALFEREARGGPPRPAGTQPAGDTA